VAQITSRLAGGFADMAVRSYQTCLFTRAPFAEASGAIAGVTVTTGHFHVLVSVILGLDISSRSGRD